MLLDSHHDPPARRQQGIHSLLLLSSRGYIFFARSRAGPSPSCPRPFAALRGCWGSFFPASPYVGTERTRSPFFPPGPLTVLVILLLFSPYLWGRKELESRALDPFGLECPHSLAAVQQRTVLRPTFAAFFSVGKSLPSQKRAPKSFEPPGLLRGRRSLSEFPLAKMVRGRKCLKTIARFRPCRSLL